MDNSLSLIHKFILTAIIEKYYHQSKLIRSHNDTPSSLLIHWHISCFCTIHRGINAKFNWYSWETVFEVIHISWGPWLLSTHLNDFIVDDIQVINSRICISPYKAKTNVNVLTSCRSFCNTKHGVEYSISVLKNEAFPAIVVTLKPRKVVHFLIRYCLSVKIRIKSPLFHIERNTHMAGVHQCWGEGMHV